jgi:hypothetical protein
MMAVERGRVVMIGRAGMALVRHSDGFAVMELFGDEVAVGEVLSHDWLEVGHGYAVRNNGERIQVMMQGSWGTAEAARRACSL